MVTVFHLDQLGGDAHLLAGLAHRTLEDVRDIQGFPDQAQILNAVSIIRIDGEPKRARRARRFGPSKDGDGDGSALQLRIDAQRAAISAEISQGFARRARLVSRLESVRKIADEHNTHDELDPEIQAISKEIVKAEFAIQKLTQKLDELEAPEPTDPDKKD